VLPIECEIPLLNIIFELLPNMTKLEAHIVHLENLNKRHRDEAKKNETHKKHVISVSAQGSFSKVTLFYFRIKTRMLYGRESLTQCGMVLTLGCMPYIQDIMNYYIMKVMCCPSREMGSISIGTTLECQCLGIFPFVIILY
jgi:hypothetical protein